MLSETIKPLLMLLFSFSGLIFGGILQIIAPEEHESGKKHFILLKKILLLLIVSVVNGHFVWQQEWTLINGIILLVFDMLIISFYLLKTKKIEIKLLSSKYLELANFLAFIIPYFILQHQFQLIYLTLIFLYGLPLGTLLLEKIQNKK